MFGNNGDNQRSDNYPIHTEKVVADRKIFFLDLKENDRGQFVKITEDVRGRRDTIMVPGEILDDFIEALQAVQEAADGDA
ncbi:MAG: DNA-binding protein [Verrucomicrobiota bacterium]